MQNLQKNDIERIYILTDYYRRERWDMEHTLVFVKTSTFGQALRKALEDAGLGLTFFHHHIVTPEAFCAKLLRGNASKVGLPSNYTILEAGEERQNNAQVYTDELVPRAIELLKRYPSVEQNMENWYPLILNEEGEHLATATEKMYNILTKYHLNNGQALH